MLDQHAYADFFVAYPPSRGFPNIKYSRSVESRRDFRARERWKRRRGWCWKQPTWKSQFLLFSSFFPSLPRCRRVILAMALSIDCLGRSARSTVLESALWYIASYYLVIMLRVGFLFSLRHRERNAKETVGASCLWCNTPEMIQFPFSDYQHARGSRLVTFPLVLFKFKKKRKR